MPAKHPNIVLFTIDSLRRDHMSCYGYKRVTTPHLDRLAAGGTLFENAFSAYIPTTPAFSTLLTGCDVVRTQQPSLRSKGPIPQELPLLPALLRPAGYRSVCVGFGSEFFRGFDTYLNFDGWVSWNERPARKAENLNAVVLPELERLARSSTPFLMLLRYLDPHAPYLPPAPFDTMFYSKNPCARGNASMKPVFAFEPFADFLRSWMPPGITDKDFVIAQYDGGLAYMDACIQQMVTRLAELDLLENTLLVITSDHGESLYDHGIYFDHHGLYEPTLSVPLIFFWPGRVPSGVRARAYTLHEDLVPTVLDVCGLKHLARGLRFDGKSNRRFFSDTAGSHRTEFYISECTWMRKHGWRTPIWKYWEALEPDFHGKPPVELYNLVKDPQERRNLAEQEPDIVAMLQNRLRRWEKRRERRTGTRSLIHAYRLGTELRIGPIASSKNRSTR